MLGLYWAKKCGLIRLLTDVTIDTTTIANARD